MADKPRRIQRKRHIKGWKMTTQKLRAVSLFTGAGGFDGGAEEAGIEIIGQCDLYDPTAIPSLVAAHEAEIEAVSWLASEAAAKKRKSIKSKWSELCNYGKELEVFAARHWPDVKRVNGVQNVKADTFSNVDVLTAGFPCQDVSIAGRRAGLAGKRSGLWFELIRAIRELEPTWVVIENTPGLLSSNRGRDFATVLSGLEQCGYGWTYRVLDSKNWGVPQRRRRVFVVGHLGGKPRPEVLFERNGGEWHSPTRQEAGPGNSAVSARAAGSGDRGRIVGGHCTGPGWWNQSEIAGTLRAEGENRPSRPSNIIAINNGGDREQIGTLTARMGRNGGGANDSIEKLIVGPLTATSMGTQGGYNNQAESGHLIAATLNNSGNSGGFRTEPGEHLVAPGLHGGVRRLTPLECFRLQSFPDHMAIGHSDTILYKMMGNAVTWKVAKWIFDRLINLTMPGGVSMARQ